MLKTLSLTGKGRIEEGTPKRRTVAGPHTKLMQVQIEKLVFGGDGLGRSDGKPIFVYKSVPGDELEIEITDDKKSYAKGVIKKIIKPSPDRIKPPCKYFDQCGGCDHQNISYQNQLKYKDQILQEVIDRAGIKIKPEKIIASSNEPFYYRNSIRFSFVQGDNQISFARHNYKNDKELVPVDSCGLQSKISNDILSKLKNYINKNIEHKSSFWQLKIREGKVTGDVMVEIITSSDDLPGEKGIVKVLKTIEGVKSIYHTVATGKSLLNLRRRLIFGSPVIYEKIGSFTFQISPESFFQPNSLGAKTLYDVVKKYSSVKFGDEIVDLYCGTGTIGIYLSTLAKKVTGIDEVTEAIRDAIDNARINKIKNCVFICLSSDNVSTKLLNNCIVIVDPPRAGLNKKLIDKISKSKFMRLIYVSCNPATFARDLKLFGGRGVAAKKIQAVDMLPQTHHIELVSLLEKI